MLIRIFKKLIERLKLFKISKLKKRNFLKKSLKIWEILGKISKILILNLKHLTFTILEKFTRDAKNPKRIKS